MRHRGYQALFVLAVIAVFVIAGLIQSCEQLLK